MNTRSKILTDRDLELILNYYKKNLGVALATGCFDVLHRGHVELLEEAAGYGNVFVGVNDDESVRKLKGPTRPVNNEQDRMLVIAGLECVKAVFLIRSDKVTDAIRLVAPDYWVKGGSYTMETLDKDEVAAAKEVGAEIVLVPVTIGYSTTNILSRILIRC